MSGVPIEPGDLFTEYYYFCRWYNIFHIADSAGRLKGWYCNVTRPARLKRDGLVFADLALDLFVHPNGGTAVLDEEEFRRLSADLPAHEVARAQGALSVLQRQARRGRLPTPGVGA